MKLHNFRVMMFVFIGLLFLIGSYVYAKTLIEDNKNGIVFSNQDAGNISETPDKKVENSDRLEALGFIIILIIIFVALCFFLGVSVKDLGKLYQTGGHPNDVLPGGD